ncbi:MAG: hypothetical protein ACR2G5_14835 [Pyrinomonadaceae bacterium]
MPKNTKKRTKVKDLPRSKQELSAKSAKKVKGGQGSTPAATAKKAKIEGTLTLISD